MCQAGAMGDRMFVLAAGTCEVVVDNDSGQAQVVATVEAPAYFGEMALIEKKPRMATVRCLGQCELFEILADDFIRLVGSSAEALDAAMEEAAKRKQANKRRLSDTPDLEIQMLGATPRGSRTTTEEGPAAPLLQHTAD